MTHTDDFAPKMNEYRTDIDTLRFSDEAKERMVARLSSEALDARETHAPTRVMARRARRLPMVAAAAGLALALGAGGVAYATGKLVGLGDFANHLFGGTEATTEVVNKVGHPVGVASSDGGVTVTADAVMGDKTNVAMVFSITKDDGTAFDVEPLENGLLPLVTSDDLHLSTPLFVPHGAYGSSYFYDEDPSDNAIQLVQKLSYTTDADVDLSLIGRTMVASLADLTYWPETGEPQVLAKGNWRLEVPLDYEDSSVELDAAGKTFDLNGVDATIDSLSISPIALHATYTAPLTGELVDAPSGREPQENSRIMEALLTLDVTVNYADGSSYAVEDSGGGSFANDNGIAHSEKGVFFDRILDLDEVESITIGGATFKL